MITLYIENTPCDLINEDIPITRQVHDLTNLETRQGNFSRQFSLPLTSLNKQLLGFPNEVNSLSNIPYTRLNAMLMYNGVQDVGFLSIESASSQFAECVFYSGNTDLFDILGNKTLNDLDLSDFDTKWDISGTGTTFFDVKDATSGVVWPIVDTGVEETYRALPVDTREVNAKSLRPAIYTKSLLEKICDLANFTIVGNFTNDDRYNKEAVFVTEQNPKHSEDYNADQVFTSTKTNSQTIPSGTQAKITFTSVTDPSFNFAANVYTVPASGQYSFRVVYLVTGVNISIPDYPIIRLRSESTGGVITELFELAITDIMVIPDAFVVENANLNIGDVVYVTVEAATNNAVFNGTVFAGSFNCTAVNDTIIEYTSLFECTGNMPNIPLKDFVRSFCVRYNLLIISDKAQQTIEFTPFKKLYENTAYDWSDKIDSRNKELEFKSNAYARNNIFSYLDDSQYEPEYASGTLTYNNPNVENEKILRQPFGASVDVTRLKGLSCPQIPMFLYDFDAISPNINFLGIFYQDFGKKTPQSVTPRIIYINQTLLTDDPIIYTDGPGSFVSGPLRTEPLAWFWNDTEPYNLSFDSTKTGNSLLTDNYTELEFMLDKFKIVTARFNLSSVDVINHDFTRPVFISYLNAYFYVNAIKDYTPNTLTEVELIRL